MKRNSMKDYENNLKILKKECPDAGHSCIVARDNKNKIEYDLTIVVPAYNVENCIARCMDSILNQKYDFSCEIIVINDGSTDKTEEIIKKYDQITYISQKNGGLSAARNTGINNAHGKYITFVDSDDTLEENAINNLMKCAIENDADIVQGRYKNLSRRNEVKFVSAERNGYVNPMIGFYGYAWGKVYKTSLFEHVQFPEGYWYEDSLCNHIMYAIAKKTYCINDVVYNYWNNQNGISHVSIGNRKSVDSLWITERLYYDRKKLGIQSTQEYYEYLLKMTLTTYQRTKKLDSYIKKCIFNEISHFTNKEFDNFETKNNKMKKIEKAVRENKFFVFKLYYLVYKLRNR